MISKKRKRRKTRTACRSWIMSTGNGGRVVNVDRTVGR